MYQGVFGLCLGRQLPRGVLDGWALEFPCSLCRHARGSGLVCWPERTSVSLQMCIAHLDFKLSRRADAVHCCTHTAHTAQAAQAAQHRQQSSSGVQRAARRSPWPVGAHGSTGTLGFVRGKVSHSPCRSTTILIRSSSSCTWRVPTRPCSAGAGPGLPQVTKYRPCRALLPRHTCDKY